MKKVKCFGCHGSFESFDMKVSDGFKDDSGNLFCSPDCHDEMEVEMMESQQYDYECGVGPAWEGY